MANDNDPLSGIGASGIQQAIQQAQQSSAESAQGAGQGSNPLGELTQDTVNQQEFLNLLVHQLQNQDPLDPMKSEEFAVQLAQFSQLEQLIGINQKLEAGVPGADAGAANSVGMMASFLGHEVVLSGEEVNISGGQGPNLIIDVPEGAQSGRIDLIDENGAPSASIDIENLEPGRQVVSLNGQEVLDGSYAVRAVAVGPSGQFIDMETKITGTVEGFVMEPEPALLIGGEQVALENVVEVYKGNS